MHFNRQLIILHTGNLIAVILMPVIPLLMTWFVASCVIYSQLIGQSVSQIIEETRWAGYRFYGILGVSCILALSPITKFFPVLHFCVFVWLISVLVVAPYSIRDIYRLTQVRYPVLG